MILIAAAVLGCAAGALAAPVRAARSQRTVRRGLRLEEARKRVRNLKKKLTRR